MRAFSHLENRIKLTVLMWTVTVITVKQCSKQWDFTTTSFLVNKLNSGSKVWTLSEVLREERRTI